MGVRMWLWPLRLANKVNSQLFEPTPCLSLAVKDEQKCYCFFHHGENYTVSRRERAEFSHSQSTTSAVRPSIRTDRREEAGAGGRKWVSGREIARGREWGRKVKLAPRPLAWRFAGALPRWGARLDSAPISFWNETTFVLLSFPSRTLRDLPLTPAVMKADTSGFALKFADLNGRPASVSETLFTY